uniref:Putative secreted protein n=1 Tax=Ixodes ricinus TaxID=34613 RepID=A0A147BIX3_IXORI
MRTLCLQVRLMFQKAFLVNVSFSGLVNTLSAPVYPQGLPRVPSWAPQNTLKGFPITFSGSPEYPLGFLPQSILRVPRNPKFP